ncbi:unnamed protein product [Thelazia callipaeda]|uniref:mRNA-decapping enzyme 2 n=1 Tax=Thelazia callipaeda TaxID=103827 RepID=A0A0N5D836_THECL|nr:unnamed protein product [Thelazia callipaeda]
MNLPFLFNKYVMSILGNEEKSDDQWRCRQKGSSKKKRLNSKSKKSLDVSSKNAKFFGPAIPDDVLDDLCFRFLINIPDDQKNIPVRLCFQIELAHWFYIDFYSSRSSSTLKCPQVSLRDLIGQIFNHCDFLIQYADKVDKVLDEWRVYKSGVPTYGAALLDSSLNYVLLVQGYFAKNSWGFPKGKINEEEEATACASREVMEEVGYDISDKISNSRLIQNLVNDTLIRLYIICDVPTDFPFAPKTRNEIGKIQWFSLWNLPKDRNDFAACEQIGMTPSNFYTVIPFVKELQAYVTQLHNGCSKLEHEAADMISFGEHSSAFSPVHPQRIKKNMMVSVSNPQFSITKTTVDVSHGLTPQLSFHNSFLNSVFCKPLSTSTLPVSYTGAAFVQMLSSGNLSATFSVSQVVFIKLLFETSSHWQKKESTFLVAISGIKYL